MNNQDTNNQSIIIEDLSTQNLAIYSQQVQVFNLVAGTATYTLGPTGTWAGSRPTHIDQAWVTYNSIDFPVEYYDNNRFNGIAFKGQTSVLPQAFSFDGSVSNATVTLWPVPTLVLPISIAANRQLTQIPTINTTLVLPPGYARMLRLLLARELQSEYGVMLSPVTLQMAERALGSVKRANLMPVEASFDPMYMGNCGSWADGYGSVVYGGNTVPPVVAGGLLSLNSGALTLDSLTLGLA